MRITNLFHFTENHRFCVFRNFSLGSMDYKVLYSIYQPMIGAGAANLYVTLYQQVAADKIGYSPLEQQRKLFLLLELEQGDKGRKFFADQASKLEAVGLLQTTRKYMPTDEDFIYKYELAQTLQPDEFFKNQHLVLLLRDKVGKHMTLFLRDELLSAAPPEFQGADSPEEDISVPFYDLFQLNTKVVDYELDQAFFEVAAAGVARPQIDSAPAGYAYADIIMRFPRQALHRPFVENLEYKPEQLAVINFIARKYDLSLQEVCRLLDEDEAFDDSGELQQEVLEYRANLMFRQDRKRGEARDQALHRAAGGETEAEARSAKPVEMQYYLDVPPLLQSRYDIHQYNAMLKNEPYTLVLKCFFVSGVVPDGVLDMYSKINLTYKLPEEVINALTHLMHVERRSWAKSSIEAVASDMSGKGLLSYEQAVEYVRGKIRYREEAAARKSDATNPRTRGKAKPKIAIVTETPDEDDLTDEEFAAMQLKARELDGRKV